MNFDWPHTSTTTIITSYNWPNRELISLEQTIQSIIKVSKLVFLIALLFCSAASFAQDIQFDHQKLTMSDGLSSNEVLCGLQSQSGFLWFGTRNGLNRYDGENFIHITKEDGLRSNHIISIAEDEAGNIYLLHGVNEGKRDARGTIDIYNPKSHTVTYFEDKITNLPAEHLKKNELLLADRYRNVYVSNTFNGRNIYKLHSDSLMLLTAATQQINQSFKSYIPIEYCLRVHNEMFLTNGKNKSKICHANDEDEIECISTSTNTSNYLFLEIKNSNDVESISKVDVDSLTYGFINNLENQGSYQQQWLDPYSSSILFAQGTELHVFKNNKIEKIVANNIIASGELQNIFYFTDRQDIAWVCTYEGLFKFTPRPKLFEILFDGKALINIVKSNLQIRGIIADSSENVYASGNFGLQYYDNVAKRYYLKQTRYLESEFFAMDQRQKEMIIFGAGLWSTDLKLTKNGQKQLVYQQPINNLGKQIGGIWSFTRTLDDNYLFGNADGKIYHWNPDQDSITQLFSSDSLLPPIGHVYSMYYSVRDTSYWFGGNGGIYRISADLNKKEYFGNQLNPNDINYLPIDQIRDIYQDDSIFWIATNGHGLVKWNRLNHSISTFGKKEGLSSNGLYRIIPDDFGYFWISSDNGLIRFHKALHSINIYTTDDGLANNEFNRMSAAQSVNGKIYFGGINGLVRFNPEDFEPDSSQLSIPLKITGYYQFLKKTEILTDLSHDFQRNEEIILKPGDGFFRLEFRLLDYRDEVKQYRYKIASQHDNWEYLNDGILRMSGLDYGNHTLQIAGQSQSGAWSTQEVQIPIKVMKPFYLTGLAYVGYGIAFLAFLYFFRKYQVTQATEKADKIRLKEIDALKTRLYANITHEFRTPLTVIMGMSEQIVADKEKLVDLIDKTADVKLDRLSKIENRTAYINRNAQILLNLINQMLDLSKIDEAKLVVNWELGDVVAFLKYIMESFESFAVAKHIDFQYESDFETLDMDYDAIKFQQIISNLLSNAIKYTPPHGKIKFHVGRSEADGIHPEGMIQIKVSNDGIGIPEDKLANIFDRFYQVDDSLTRKGEGSGIGLSLAKELADLMGGDILVDSMIDQRTTFTLLLPIHRMAGVTVAAIEPPAGEINQARVRTDHISDETIVDSDLPIALVVEDNPDVADYIKLCLEEHYSILWVENGQLGIEKAIEIVPDLIVSDVMMPIKDGYEVTHTLKTDERTSHIPIILLTAKSSIDSRITGLERGADAYITKPFETKELIAQANNLLALRKKLQSFYSIGIENRPSLSKHRGEAKGDSENKIEFEHAFIIKIHAIFDEQLADFNFDIPILCERLNMSHSQLYRKVKALTGQSLVAYIRNYKLEKGKALIDSTELTIAEVCYRVGFSDPSYFSKMFMELYGKLPSELR